LFTTTIFSGSRFVAIVASSGIDIWKPPSPTSAITSLSGFAICAPIAAGTLNPIEPSPPEVSHRRGWLKRMNCAAHIWCWPTSVVTMASPLEIRSTSNITCCGLISFTESAGLSGCSSFQVRICRHQARRPSLLRADISGAISSSTFTTLRSTRLASPTMGRSGARFLPISAGSMSMWITLACGAKAASRPVTRSSKRTPTAISRSAAVIAMFAA
jgi:hypothetical protein